MAAEVATAVRHGGWRGEALLPRQDGSSIPALLDINLIRDEKNTMQGAVAIFEDISERKRMEEQLHRADRLATAGEMAAGIAHEVNNALVGILRQRQGQGRGRRDGLAARLRAGRVAGEPHRRHRPGAARLRAPAPAGAPANLGAGVDRRDARVPGLRSQRRRASCRRSRSPADLPPSGSIRSRCEQVLVNLVTNARQAMADTGGRLQLSARREGRNVVICVRDTGAGIEPDHLKRAFDPFFTTKAAGTGLGLSVTYQIVRAHDGDITVESTLGERYMFHLRLPVAIEAHRERALVIDDDEAGRRNPGRDARRTGSAGRARAVGREALERLNGSNEYDVVFSTYAFRTSTGRRCTSDWQRPIRSRRAA